MNKKSIWAAIAVILIVLVIWGTKNSSKNQSQDAGEPIKIGVIYGFTGSAATWADMGKKAVDLAVKEVNTDGGIDGRKLQVIYEDSQANPAKDVSAFNKLVLTDKVNIVMGDVWSFITNPMIPLADQQKVMLISPTVMDASVEKSSPYFYTTGHTIESQRESIEKFFAVNPSVKTISILCWNDAWGNANKTLLLDILQKKNIKVVSSECTNDFSATYQSEMTKVKAANPDAIYFSTGLPDVVLRKIKDLGLGDKKVLGLSTTFDAIEVNKTPIPYLKNVYFVIWTPGQDFADKFKKEYGVAPILEAQNHYDTIRAIALALKMGGDFKESLKKVTFTGVEGYKFDFTKGDPIRVNEGKAGLYTFDGTYHKI